MSRIRQADTHSRPDGNTGDTGGVREVPSGGGGGSSRKPDRVEPPRHRRPHRHVPTRDGGPRRTGDTGRTGSIDDGIKPDEAGALWTERVLADGTQGYMDALLHGDPSAKAALKNPEFMAILQQKMKEENQLVTMISNLIDVQHRSAMASINNMRV